jgi:hypothetical protein
MKGPGNGRRGGAGGEEGEGPFGPMLAGFIP